MLINIYTFHRAYNQGAVLQAFALSTFLKSIGHIVTFPDCNNVGADRAHFQNIKLTLSPITEAIKSIIWYMGSEVLNIGPEDLRRLRFKRFVRNHLHINHKQHPSGCAVYGSDQIWNDKLTQEAANIFLGENSTAKARISYAASIGDNDIDDAFKSKLISAAQTFDALSLREGVPFDLHDKKGRPPTMVVDPTLLISKADYEKVACKHRLHKRKYAFVYLALPCPESFSAARYVASVFNLDIICVDASQRGLWRKPKEVTLTCSPDRFLAYLRDAEFVITNSFHGTAMSLIFNKQFAAIPATKTDKIPHRVSNLLSNLNLANRASKINRESYGDLLRILQMPLPTNLQQTIGNLAQKSKDWLTEELDTIQQASHA